MICYMQCYVGYMFCVSVIFCQKYYHGESIAINVLVDNNTNKSVKKVKISGKLGYAAFIIKCFLDM